MATAPNAGQEYPIVLGESFTSGNPTQSFYSFHYMFMPSTMDIKMPGSMILQNKTALLQFEHPSEEPKEDPICFEGSYANLDQSDDQQNVECLLVFDPEKQCFRLERLSAQVTSLNLDGDRKKRKAMNRSSSSSSSSSSFASTNKKPRKDIKTLNMLHTRPKPQVIKRRSPKHSALTAPVNTSTKSTFKSTSAPPASKPKPNTYIDLEGKEQTLPPDSDSDSDSDSSSGSDL